MSEKTIPDLAPAVCVVCVICIICAVCLTMRTEEDFVGGDLGDGNVSYASRGTVDGMTEMVVYPIPDASEKMIVPSGFCIPPIVHICWRNEWVSSSMYNDILVRNAKMLQGMETRFYTNESIIAFLQSYFPPIVLETFFMINPAYGACMSDFFRYCVLYVFGGMYMDIKSSIIRPLERLWEQEFVGDDKELLFVSYWPNASFHRIQETELGNQYGEIMNWVICCSPGHPFMKKMIDQMVQNIQSWHKQKYRYGEKVNVLRLTGPIFMTKFIMNAGSDESIVISNRLNDYVRYTHNTSPNTILNDRRVYQEAGVPHYSSIHDQIVLFRYTSPSKFVFYFQRGTRTPVDAKSSGYILRPIPADPNDPKRLAILHDMLLMLDADMESMTTRFLSLPMENQNDIIRCALLHDHGGIFIDPTVRLNTNGIIPWDCYTQYGDAVMFMDPTTMRISTRFLQFPSQSPFLRHCIRSILSIPPPGTLPTSLPTILTSWVNKYGTPKKGSGGGMVFPVDSSKSSEIWMVGSTQQNWKTLWSPVSNAPANVLHFCGQVVAEIVG